MNKLKYLAAVLIAIAGFGLQQAKAFESDLTVGNTGLGQFQNAGPFAHVSITLIDSTHATVTFTSLTNGGNIYLMGDGGAVALQVNATSFAVVGGGAGVSGTNSGTNFTPGPYTIGSGNEDGFGSFNLKISSFDGFSHAADTITFTLTNLSGTWATQADVVTANGKGYDAGAHIFPAVLPADGHNNVYNINTGFAVEPAHGNVVPDGGTTVMLLGMGFGALGMARRFFLKG
jgi:VPDSG-CTERM motif